MEPRFIVFPRRPPDYADADFALSDTHFPGDSCTSGSGRLDVHAGGVLEALDDVFLAGGDFQAYVLLERRFGEVAGRGVEVQRAGVVLVGLDRPTEGNQPTGRLTLAGGYSLVERSRRIDG